MFSTNLPDPFLLNIKFLKCVRRLFPGRGNIASLYAGFPVPLVQTSDRFLALCFEGFLSFVCDSHMCAVNVKFIPIVFVCLFVCLFSICNLAVE